MANRVVILFGKLLDSKKDGYVVLDVDPDLGDAREFGLAGQVTFLRRQVIEDTYVSHGRDVVRVPEHIARLKSELAGNVRKRKKGR